MIPCASKRLMCLSFQAAWAEAERKCREDLQVLQDGLAAISERLQPLQRFFHTALLLGNMLNRGGGLMANRGFKLSSLILLVQMKSSAQPNLQLMHVILALLKPEEVESLRSGQLALAAAKARKSSGVLQSCKELLDGFSHTKRQRDLVPLRRIGANSDIDPRDRFQAEVSNFCERTRRQARALAQLGSDVFKTYWELAQFFEEPGAVYPPPKNETDTAEDIFLVFHRLGTAVEKAEHALLRPLRLREELAEVRKGGLPFILKATALAAELKAVKEVFTDASALLVTPPTSPTKHSAGPRSPMGKVASPLRSRGSLRCTPLPSATVIVSRLLRQRKTAPGGFGPGEDSDKQSDVSDWEPTSMRRAAPPRAARASVPAPREDANAAARRRRRRRMLSPPRSLSPPSPSSTGQAESTAPSVDPTPPSPTQERLVFAPPQRPAAVAQLNSRKSGARQSLSAMADRFEQTALSKLGLDSEDCWRDAESSSSCFWASCPTSPAQSSDRSRSQSLGCSSKALSLQLQSEVIRRRSLSRIRTPRCRPLGVAMASLTPVDEPGETPGCRSSGPKPVVDAESAGTALLGFPMEPRCIWKR